MISREMMIGGGALVALLLAGSVAYASSSSSAAAAPAAGTLVFTAGHRYEIDFVVPPNTTYTPSTMPSAPTVQSTLETLASGAFTVVSVGAEVSSTAAPGSGFTAYFLVDCLKTTTLAQADLLAGAPAGTTVTATDEGLTSAALPTGASYDGPNAIAAPLGTTTTVPVGSSIALQIPGGSSAAYWQTPAATTSNAAIVVSAAQGSTGFVAVAPGTATLTGYYVDAGGTKQTATVVVTVVAKAAGAISSSGSAKATSGSSSTTSTPSSSSGSATVISTTVVGKPIAGGWQTTITLGPDSVTVSGWVGDTIIIQPPSGGTWAATGSTAGFPTSGSTPFQATYASPVVVALAWSLGGVSFSTTITFQTGRTFGLATSWQPNDTVRVSLDSSDYTAMNTAAYASAAEYAALKALIVTLQNQGLNPSSFTPSEAFYYFLQTGPWGALTSPVVSTIQVWSEATTTGSSTSAKPSSFPIGGQALPTDWPASDTTGLIRAEFQYSGAGITNAELPFPCTSWVRLT
jgi:hypothetical protein